MSKRFMYFTCAAIVALLLGGVAQAAHDITGPLDAVVAVPNDGDWPPNEVPRQACDDQVPTKYLHFKGGSVPSGIRVTPVAGPTVVTGVTFTTANDSDYRDPISYELSGSNESIDGPYTLIASGPIKDFAGAVAWARRTKTTTPMRFANTVSYKHYQLLFPKTRDPATEPYMQIAEIELLVDDLVAYNPNPANGATGVQYGVLWWTPGDFALLEDVYISTTPDFAAAEQIAKKQPAVYKMAMYPKPLLSGQEYYWRVDDYDNKGNLYTGTVWSFTAVPLTAHTPSPVDGDKWIPTDVTLSWQAGSGATTHRLYFGADKAAVTSRDASTLKAEQMALSYDVAGLAENTTYSWAVDEIVVGGTRAGDVWSFTTTGPGGGIKGEYFNNTTMSGMPALTRIDPEVNFSWAGDGPGAPIGTAGYSVRWTADLDIAVADTYTFAITSAGGTRLWIDGEPIIDMWVSWVPTTYGSLPTFLDRGIHSLRLEYANWDRTDAQQVLYWERPGVAQAILPAGPLQPPLRARALYPGIGDVNIPQDVTLVWSVGEKAAEHDVYFGDDANAVAGADTSSSLYMGRQTETSFVPGLLDWNKTYYWRVDEVNEAEADGLWQSSVWAFTTADFLVVDNFESYNDVEGQSTRIYETWLDGLMNGTSSTVGYWDPPFAEQTIVHGGAQSMPLDYNNIIAPYYSEAEREFLSLQDWTVNGVTDLTLYLRGYPVRFAETADGIILSGAGSDIYGGTDEFRFAWKRLTGDGSIAVRVADVNTVESWTKAGVMIRESLDPLAKQVHMVTGAQQGVIEWMYRAITNDTVVTNFNTAGGSTPVPIWVRITRVGNVFTGEYSTDNKTWTKITQTDGTASTTTINMPGTVYVGMVVSSHLAGVPARAQFTDIKTTGTVSGSWQATDVGVVHPGNDPATLYVVLQDSANKTALVANPDPAAVNAMDWTEWKIPLSSFSGVSLNKIKKIYIGVGDRQALVPDGHGLLFIDDIRVTKP
jgi:hypothetical protein